MVVAIDGPAGTGKSTVSTEIAARTGFAYLNSGRFYRAVTWKALQQNRNLENPNDLLEVAQEIEIDVVENRFLVDGSERDEELHAAEIDTHVAPVSSVPDVRNEINRRLKRIAGRRDIIVEGRDMSTVVFPNAEVKIYLDADPVERARRRHVQQGGTADIQQLAESIRERDRLDRAKGTGRLEQAPDAVYLDTTDLTLDQVCDRVIAIIHEKSNTRQE